ncbi:YgiQ family radical SAM protein [Halocella sp. SP3-1]|nr:YgiQ family radical SAM protein [Halocella sp. SP3-1]AZO94716.1 YgiQ family radical SAM protein [Halocella sp. SP3-1]
MDLNREHFMVIDKKDMEQRGWEGLDFIIISGDAYIDHPSFGTAIIARLLEDAGFKVGIIPQPDWRSTNDFKKLGTPRLAFLVTAGNMDSMVNHYTVNKKRRRDDAYSPGGRSGRRPDRATIVYCNRLKEVFKETPLIIGGIEASLRRFAHYDYWDNKVRRSILFDSRADLLVYGMGERQVLEIAENLDSGLDINYIRHIPGTAYIIDDLDELYGYQEIDSFQEVVNSKEKYARSFKKQYDEQDPIRGNILVQSYDTRYLVQNPPVKPLDREMMDLIYSLPYQRNYHPIYEKQGGVPAINEVKYSITNSRGCFGSCSFCALSFHQGRAVVSRSKESIINEARKIIADSNFKGYIHDVGGPTANFRNPACSRQLTKGSCINRQCLFPSPCQNMEIDHSEYLDILRTLRSLEGVKKVFIRSGLRFDYIMADGDDSFFKELCQHHISGLLKVAPEHIASDVLELMGKPANAVFEGFRKKFYRINKEIGKEQYLIPYLISSHPGSTLESAVELAEYLRDINHHPEQVQDFYPTPGTLSTTMFYTGYDPRTMKSVYVPRSREERKMQRALLQYHYPRNYQLVYKALELTGRQDLIGYHQKALIRPKKSK